MLAPLKSRTADWGVRSHWTDLAASVEKLWWQNYQRDLAPPVRWQPDTTSPPLQSKGLRHVDLCDYTSLQYLSLKTPLASLPMLLQRPSLRIQFSTKPPGGRGFDHLLRWMRQNHPKCLALTGLSLPSHILTSRSIKTLKRPLNPPQCSITVLWTALMTTQQQ